MDLSSRYRTPDGRRKYGGAAANFACTCCLVCSPGTAFFIFMTGHAESFAQVQDVVDTGVCSVATGEGGVSSFECVARSFGMRYTAVFARFDSAVLVSAASRRNTTCDGLALRDSGLWCESSGASLQHDLRRECVLVEDGTCLTRDAQENLESCAWWSFWIFLVFGIGFGAVVAVCGANALRTYWEISRGDDSSDDESSGAE